MNREIFRLVFGCSLSMIVGVAMAQERGSTHSGGSGNSGNSGGSHSSGSGGGYSGGSSSRSSGGGSGGYNGGSRSSGGYRGGSESGSGGSYSSRYGSSSYSRYQSRSSDYSGRSTSSSSTSRYGGSTSSRYSSGGYQSRSGSTGSVGSGSTSRYSSGSENTFDRGHANLSRSGPANYTGNNNRNIPGQAPVGDARFGPAPHGLMGPASLGHVLGNGGGGGLVRGGYRVGYFGYFGGWRDSFFAFPFSVFDPFLFACYVSPWYYYPCLPGYVAAPNVVIVNEYPSTNWTGSDYEWQPGTQNTSNPVLDDSIQDIVQSFETDDHKAIDRLIPHSGNVNIYVDGKYSYSLKANDFYDTYVDGIESTKTDRYEILDVKANADGTARVTAKHVYNDPWGNRTYVYHSYFLAKEGDEYVIREFGTSDYKTGW